MFAYSGLLTMAMVIGGLSPECPDSPSLAPQSALEPGQISYEVRFLERLDLNWRSAIHSRLHEVARRGASVVWTIDDPTIRVFMNHLMENNTRTNVVQAPKVTAFEGAEAVVADLTQRRFVTNVQWITHDQPGDSAGFAAEPKVDAVEIGQRMKLSGRLLDQGTLLRVDLQEKNLEAVHKATSRPNDDESLKVQATYQVPEISQTRIEGEWLVPPGQSLLIGFGPRTVQGDSGKDKGKPVVQERLVLITPRRIVTEAEERVVQQPAPLPPRMAPPAPIAPIYLPPAPEGVSGVCIQPAVPAPVSVSGSAPMPYMHPGMPAGSPIMFGPMPAPTILMLTPEGPLPMYIQPDGYDHPVPAPGMPPMMGLGMGLYDGYGHAYPQMYPMPMPMPAPHPGMPYAAFPGPGPIVPDMGPHIPSPVLPDLPPERPAPDAKVAAALNVEARDEGKTEAEGDDDEGPMPEPPARTLPMGFTPDGKPAPPPPLPDEDAMTTSLEESADPLPSPQTRPTPAMRDAPKSFAHLHDSSEAPRLQVRQIPIPRAVVGPRVTSRAIEEEAFMGEGACCSNARPSVVSAENFTERLRRTADLIEALNETLDQYCQEHPEAKADPMVVRMQFRTGPGESFQIQAGNGVRAFEVEFQHDARPTTRPASLTEPADCCPQSKVHYPDKAKGASTDPRVHPASSSESQTKGDCCKDCPDPAALEEVQKDLDQAARSGAGSDGKSLVAKVLVQRLTKGNIEGPTICTQVEGPVLLDVRRAVPATVCEEAAKTGFDAPKSEPAPATVDPEAEGMANWSLTLAEAVRIGLENSESVRITRLGVCGDKLLSPVAPCCEPNLFTEIACVHPDASPCGFRSEVSALVRSIEEHYWNLAEQQVCYWGRKQAVKLASAMRDREQTRLAAGNGSEPDVAETEEVLRRFQIQVIEATSDLITAERELRAVLGLKPNDGCRIIPTSLDKVATCCPESAGDSPAELVREVEANTKLLGYAVLVREAAERRLEVQRNFYETRTISNVRYLESINNWAKAVAQVARAEAACNVSIATLEEAKGTLLDRYRITFQSMGEGLEAAPVAEVPPVDPEAARADFVPPTPEEQEEIQAGDDVTHAVEASAANLAEAIRVGREAARFAREASEAAREMESTLRLALVAGKGLARAFRAETDSRTPDSGRTITPEMISIGLSLAEAILRQTEFRPASREGTGSPQGFEIRIPVGNGMIEFRSESPR